MTESNQEWFSISQAQWTDLQAADGFIAQVGGWSGNNPLEACIVALWRDEDAYRFFMDHLHDEIVRKNKQEKSYDRIFVRICDLVSETQLSAHEIVSHLKAATRMRMVDFDLPGGVELDFAKRHSVDWEREGSVQSALFGCTGRMKREEERYVAVDFWPARSAISQQNDLFSIAEETGEAEVSDIELVDAWTVLGGR